MPSSGFKTCARSEEHTSELQSHDNLVCRLLLEKTLSRSSGSQRHARGTEHRARLDVPAARAHRARRAAAAAAGLRTLTPRCRPFFFLKDRAPPPTSPFPPPRPFAT